MLLKNNMEKNNKIVLMSVLIAIIALFIVLLILSFIILNQKAKKAGVENIINPFAINASLGGAGSVNIYSGGGSGSDDDDDDDDDKIDGNPYISILPDITIAEDHSKSLDLDNYVKDSNNTLDELVWNFSGNTNINVSINNTTHVVTFTPLADWNGAENITFQVTDPDGLYDTDTMTVTVTPVDDPAVWNSLSDQSVEEDSADGTIVYANLTGQVYDPDSTITITVTSTHTHFDLSMSGNDLVISNLEANWYGVETVNLNANGASASFVLTVNNVEDCREICDGRGRCYEYCD